MLSRERYLVYRDELRKAQHLMEDTCEVVDTVRGSSPEPPYVQHTITVRGVDAARRERNMKRIDRLLGRCAEVEAEIALAPASVSGLLKAKYILGLQWDQVGERFGLKPDTARMRVMRWFDTRKPQR